MKKLRLFELKFCPYCIKAKRYLEQLMEENPNYRNIEIEMIDERKQRALANQYDYYLVPTFYLGDEKLHEGAIRSKDEMEAILKKALAE